MGSLSENEFGMFVAWHLLDTKAKLKSQFCTNPKHNFFYILLLTCLHKPTRKVCAIEVSLDTKLICGFGSPPLLLPTCGTSSHGAKLTCKSV
jgi:hypothetical protein